MGVFFKSISALFMIVTAGESQERQGERERKREGDDMRQTALGCWGKDLISLDTWYTLYQVSYCSASVLWLSIQISQLFTHLRRVSAKVPKIHQSGVVASTL